MKRFINLFYEENGYMIFLAIVLVYWLISFITNEILITDSILFNSLYGQIPENYIDDLIAWQKKWSWVSYLLYPVVLIIKWLVITSFISAGSVFKGLRNDFKSIFKIVMICEWLIVIIAFTNLIILFFTNIQSIEDIQRYNISFRMSLGTLFIDNELLSWLVMPLSILSFFQIVYVLLLSAGMSVITDDIFKKHLSWVSISYGSAIFIWIVFITYLNVTYG